jgi:SAM-dependent methyltransferase
LALKHHTDDQARFDQQVENSRDYVVPFIEVTKSISSGTNVLEIGCGEGGVLRPFIEKGAYCVGVDLDGLRIDLANKFFAQEIQEGKVTFLLQNIYEEAFDKKYNHFFDVIILKDVIEHVPEQEKFIPFLRNFLKPGGQIFFGFPPWYMPFGGHQQLCKGKFTSMMPYYHILPRPIYKGILNLAKESDWVLKDLMEIKDTQITIERFERIVKRSNMKVLHKQHYLFNPIYKYKFGLKPTKQLPLISAIPYLRDFVTTCVYYTIS